MACPSRHLAYAWGALAGMIVAAAAAQDQQIYRYVDPNGRIIYSDHVPPPDAKSVEAKKLTPNLIETDQVALGTRRAQDRFPLTLYTFPCGDVCDRAEALLNRRGVPYTTVNVQEQSGAEKLKKLTGELQVPVLQAGDKLVIKGFSDVQWQMLLDNAGYPAAPATRRTAPTAGPPKGAAAPAPAAPAAPPSGGYPQN